MADQWYVRLGNKNIPVDQPLSCYPFDGPDGEEFRVTGPDGLYSYFENIEDFKDAIIVKWSFYYDNQLSKYQRKRVNMMYERMKQKRKNDSRTIEAKEPLN